MLLKFWIFNVVSLMYASPIPFNKKEIKKIAVLRANSMGDFVFVLPALRALKESYPNAELIYLGNQWHYEFLKKRPGYIDKVYVVPKWNGIPHESDKVRNIEEAEVFFKKIKEEKIDIAFQMHGGGRNSNPFVSQLGAKVTVGLKAEDAPPLDINVPYYLYQNEIYRYLEVASKIDARTSYLAPELIVTNDDLASLCKKIGALHEPYVIFHPGASSIRRRWPVEKFAETANYLGEKGFYIYITGVAEEFDLTNRLYSLLKFPAKNITAKINAAELLALCSKADLVVSNDTGPLHFARAVNSPNIGIFWGANLITAGPVKMEYSAVCPDWTIHCKLCGADSTEESFEFSECDHLVSFVSKVRVEEVVGKADLLLEKHGEMV